MAALIPAVETYLAASPLPSGAGRGAGGAGRSADVLLCGVPWDRGSSFRSGPAAAPAAIRRASQVLEEHSFDLGRDLRSLRLIDAGDLDLDPSVPAAGTIELITAGLRELVGTALSPTGLLVLMGGDHLVTVPAVAAMTEADRGGEPPAVLILDAHADLREDWIGERLSHACVTRLLIEALGPERVQAAGVRSAASEELGTQIGANLAWRARRGRPEPLDLAAEACRALAALPAQGPLYLSIDIDICDPGHAPGVGAPEPGGVSSAELLRTVQLIAATAGRRLRALDVVEVSPAHDAGDTTSVLAAKLIREACLARLG